ncbi:MAG: trypsin-like peptidase domain-containing protein [Thermoleophilaceae bacterium]|nr:trypsin-like peptidase domain-containing protein [Thermoleophilaceae bacterium]
MSAPVRLTVRSGEARGASVTVVGGRIVIGRADDCDITVPDGKVSRHHAALEPGADGRVSLVDLGSSNGTFLDGRRVESAEIDGQAQIQVGDTVLVSSPGGGAGQATVFGEFRSKTHSAIERIKVRRSARRASVLSGLALVAAAVVAVLLFTASDPDAVQRVVRAAEPGTVLIQSADGNGTGWVLDGRAGLIVTNSHVASVPGPLQVGVGGELRSARRVGVAPCEDLAVLRVAGAAGLASLPLGRQSDLALGETVVAVGYPRNASLEASLTSTTGVVSVAGSAYRERSLDLPRYPNVIQTDAAINPGNSGGPLLDLDGRVIGVTSAGRTINPEGRIVQGQNYAIGVDRVREIADRLRTGRSIGWTGASFRYLTPAELRRRGLPAGIPITGAAPGTPAARARLGGSLLVAVDGRPVGNSLAGYCDALELSGARRAVTLSVLRPGAARAARVRLPLA